LSAVSFFFIFEEKYLTKLPERNFRPKQKQNTRWNRQEKYLSCGQLDDLLEHIT